MEDVYSHGVHTCTVFDMTYARGKGKKHWMHHQ